jgi:c-di-GMP-binding flagellar brake protein YcgR
MPHKEVSLTIERFYNDEDIEFRIKSKKAMQSILQSIADQGTHVGLFYGNGNNFILTMLLGANEHGMWLDVGPFPPENKQLLLSDKITFVSTHQHVKVQFVAHDIQNDLFENNEAFYMELPDYLLRIQRREFFRIAVPSTSSAKCIIPIQPENPDDPVIMREVPIEDISGGGIGLLCEEHEAELLPEKVFPDCRISIPEVGVLTVTIEVKNGINFSTGAKVQKRVGCLFIDMNNQANILLQRYITRMQSENLVKQE